MIDFQAIEDQYALPLFPKRGITLVKGKNARLWDDKGNEYIDCMGGQGVVNIGHCNDKVAEAIARQAQQLITCTGSFYSDQRALLIKKLVDITPANLNKVFLCNSGAESVEGAIKFARLSTGKTEFICAMRSFHGRTMGALSATFNPKYREPFEPLIPGFHFVPYNNIEKVEEKINDKTAAVMLEMVQGEGGVHLGDADFFKQISRLCEEKNILLIIDEVQTGFCRTGKLFAIEHFNLQPDILCLAKAMAGGLPIGAVLCSDKIDVSFGSHGTTFGGNPLVAAAANAAIDFMIEENLAGQAAEKGNYFAEKFTKIELEKVREFRQIGLMIGIELKEKVQPYITALQEKGVLVIPAGATVLRLLPPLTINKEDLDKVIEKIAEVLS
ncbi:MAG: acetylornithine/succinylornithine family transaminase [Calditrichaceae bacterium]|nr:acetylornithine/succinylornithine family transaminase [Calditrichaceae bacterium]